jgi:hypothetical protein
VGLALLKNGLHILYDSKTKLFILIIKYVINDVLLYCFVAFDISLFEGFPPVTLKAT